MPVNDAVDQAAHGWSSTFPAFRATSARDIRTALSAFVRDASPEQVRAGDDSIPPLQREVGRVMDRSDSAQSFGTVLEYELPMEFRRTDVILLVDGAVMVLELKGKSDVTRADLDEVSAYARDLRAYHRECESRPVRPVLVLMRAKGRLGEVGGVEVVGPDVIASLAEAATSPAGADILAAKDFLAAACVSPVAEPGRSRPGVDGERRSASHQTGVGRDRADPRVSA